MAPAFSDSGSSSSDEGDGPESISLSQSRQHAKNVDETFKQLHAAEKQKKRLRNKERDQRLKEQAERSKKRKDERGGDSNLELRMHKAMQEAEMEDDEDGNDEEMDMADITESARPKSNPNHLPDHLFTSAFSKSTTTTPKHRTFADMPRKARKRTRTHSSSKDILIGSRAIRTLGSGVTQPGASTIPSTETQKFFDRSLALTGVTAKKHRWERRPVNIGVMRRNGAPTKFVRNP